MIGESITPKSRPFSSNPQPQIEIDYDREKPRYNTVRSKRSSNKSATSKRSQSAIDGELPFKDLIDFSSSFKFTKETFNSRKKKYGVGSFAFK